MTRVKEDFDWERAAIEELYREYRLILHIHRLKLRPAVLSLSDSQTHWGSWEPMTRTILLSRKLIIGHSWYQVLGILRHEIAHQFVDEAMGKEPKPHGTEFREACRKVGVPEEFSGATAHLSSSRLDWKLDPRSAPVDRLMDKVRKLLALATSSNEHEALLAMNKVRELYAKHQLEYRSVEHPGPEASRYARVVISHARKRLEIHQEKIAGILVGHFFVQVLTLKQYDAATGEHHRAIELIGARENVLMAEYVYFFLSQQLELLLAQAVKEAGRKLSRIERKSYRLGVLNGFAEKLAEAEFAGRATEEPESFRSSNDGTLIAMAMTRFRQDRALGDYVARIHPRLSTKRGAWHRLDDQAFDAGTGAGRALNLKKALTEAEGNRGRLLTD